MVETKSTQDVAKELQQLVVDYGKQETIDPLRNLGRYIGVGLAGSVLVGGGITMILLAVLRLLQAIGVDENRLGHETGGTFNGDLSFIPYLIVAILSGLAIGALYLAVQGSSKSRKAAKSAEEMMP